MYKNEITQQCESMSDEELISALTVDKHEYSMDFHNAVQVELKNRNIEIENLINMVRLKFNDQEDLYVIKKALLKDPSVEYVEPNYVYQVCVTPNDPNFYLQWGLKKVGAALAWDVQTGDDSVVIAVIN